MKLKDNYQGVRAIVQYGWLPQRETFLRYHMISLTGYDLRNTLTGLHETTSGILKWAFEAKKGFYGNFSANWFLEDLVDTIILGK